jgi:hypothetical protein
LDKSYKIYNALLNNDIHADVVGTPFVSEEKLNLPI